MQISNNIYSQNYSNIYSKNLKKNHNPNFGKVLVAESALETLEQTRSDQLLNLVIQYAKRAYKTDAVHMLLKPDLTPMLVVLKEKVKYLQNFVPSLRKFEGKDGDSYSTLDGYIKTKDDTTLDFKLANGEYDVTDLIPVIFTNDRREEVSILGQIMPDVAIELDRIIKENEEYVPDDNVSCYSIDSMNLLRSILGITPKN